MATFPSLAPGGRTITPPAPPHTAHRVGTGREVRVRHSNALVNGRMRVLFPLLTRAELLSVRDHYRTQQGGFLAFDIDAATLLADVAVANRAIIAPPGYRWRYAAPPSVVDVPIDDDGGPLNRYSLSVELELVPPEPWVVAGTRFQLSPALSAGQPARPMELFAVATLAGGDAVGYEYLALVELAGGEPSRPMELVATASLAGGEPSKPLALPVTAALAGGEPAMPLELVATATLAGGAPSRPLVFTISPMLTVGPAGPA
jgi:hypothetical protein